MQMVCSTGLSTHFFLLPDSYSKANSKCTKVELLLRQGQSPETLPLVRTDDEDGTDDEDDVPHSTRNERKRRQSSKDGHQSHVQKRRATSAVKSSVAVAKVGFMFPNISILLKMNFLPSS